MAALSITISSSKLPSKKIQISKPIDFSTILKLQPDTYILTLQGSNPMVEKFKWQTIRVVNQTSALA